jgi:hypothetical protein
VAQSAGSPPSDQADVSLVTTLCAANTDDAEEIAACLESVEAILARSLADDLDETPGIVDEAQSLADDTRAFIDDAVGQAGAIDLQAALDDAIAGAQESDVQVAIDDVVAAVQDIAVGVEVDVREAIDGAMTEALAATEEIDLRATVDEALAGALAAAEDADVQATVDDAMAALEGSIAEARDVIAAAETWAQENPEVVCRGGSVGVGTTVGLAVFVLTGVEWLGLQAFRATESFTSDVCGDITE